MAYPAHRPFESPYCAGLPERIAQAGVLAMLFGIALPAAAMDRLFGRARLERQPTLISVLERHR